MDKLNHPFFVIMGPSGSGKTAVTADVFPKEYKVISHTTRKRRANERNGVDYYFETKESFQQLIDNQQLVEYDEYHGNYYGVGLQGLINSTTNHYAYDVLTYNGFKAISEKFDDAVIPIFFDVTKQKVQERLAKRETDKRIIAERLSLYDEEMKIKPWIVENKKSYVLDANKEFPEVCAILKKIIKEKTE